MIGISWTEMLIIGVFALIFIGPKELPAMMQRLGKVVGTVRRMGSEFQRELNRTTGLDQVTDLRRSLTEPLKKTTQEIAREFNKITPTGVEPTGVIKPADPKAESVVSEIKAAAGLPAATAATSAVAAPSAAESMKAAVTAAVAEKSANVVEGPPAKTGPVKAAITPAKAADAKPAKKPAARTRRAASPANGVAVEQDAPVKKAPARRKATAKPASTETTAAKPKAPAKPRASRKPTAPDAAPPAVVTDTPAEKP